MRASDVAVLDERWQQLGGGLGVQLTCDCLARAFEVTCTEHDSLALECTQCGATALVLTVWEECA